MMVLLVKIPTNDRRGVLKAMNGRVLAHAELSGFRGRQRRLGETHDDRVDWPWS